MTMTEKSLKMVRRFVVAIIISLGFLAILGSGGFKRIQTIPVNSKYYPTIQYNPEEECVTVYSQADGLINYLMIAELVEENELLTWEIQRVFRINRGKNTLRIKIPDYKIQKFEVIEVRELIPDMARTVKFMIITILFSILAFLLFTPTNKDRKEIEKEMGDKS